MRNVMMIAGAMAAACSAADGNQANGMQEPANVSADIAAAPPEVVSSSSAPVIEGECGAARMGTFIGQAYARGLDQALKRQSGAVTMRVQTPASTAAIDIALAPRRLNVLLDGEGRIAEFICG